VVSLAPELFVCGLSVWFTVLRAWLKFSCAWLNRLLWFQNDASSAITFAEASALWLLKPRGHIPDVRHIGAHDPLWLRILMQAASETDSSPLQRVHQFKHWVMQNEAFQAPACVRIGKHLVTTWAYPCEGQPRPGHCENTWLA